MNTPPVYDALSKISDAMDILDSNLAALPVDASLHRKNTLDRIRRILREYKTVKPEMP